MRAGCLVALLVTGCLAAPPDPAGNGGADGADGDDGEDGDSQPGDGTDGDGGGGADGCVEDSELDLVWVSEVAFDHTAQDQVTLRGLMILVNPGPDPLELGSLIVMPPDDEGAVQADFSLSGRDLSLAPGEAMGALNTGASVALSEFDEEEWTNLHVPELDAVLTFDGSGEDTEVPLRLQIGGFAFDLSISVVHDPISPAFDWARDARRTTAFCE